MEGLCYVLGEQVGGAAGVRRSEQPDYSKTESSVCVCVCVCVCVKRELVPRYENGPRNCRLFSLFSRANDPVHVPGEKSLRP